MSADVGFPCNVRCRKSVVQYHRSVCVLRLRSHGNPRIIFPPGMLCSYAPSCFLDVLLVGKHSKFWAREVSLRAPS